MPFIIGTPIPENKILVQSVSQIYGIGLSQSKILCRKAGFGQDCRGKNVSFSQGKILGNLAENTSLFLGSDLRRFRNDKIRLLCLMSSYRGLRHKKGLPVRPSFMGIVFGVYRNWIGEFGALKVDNVSMPRPSQPMRTTFGALSAAQASKSRTGCENVCEIFCVLSGVALFQLCFFSIRPSGEIRSRVESPSTLDSGIIAILARLPLRRLHVYCILCPLARPKSQPTRPRSGLIAVSRRSRAQRELQRALPRRRHRNRPTP